ncbi:tyrosine-type recombinase/integrase [Hellea balneolensis]|uniref:tyrosine-type recombinase/integrase n=1 Tax=Hellea balneolensis TaxID=287478 RepID=UPI0004789494|nr:site-specific integrase [Hellea balneolensis]
MATFNRLTAAKIKSLQKQGKRARCADGGGLYAVITASGGINWSYLYMQNGIRREIGLGGSKFSLSDARKRAAIVRSAINNGNDPAQVLKPKAPRSFLDAAKGKLESLNLHEGNAKNQYQWERTAYEHCKPLHNKPIETISTDDVLKVIKPIWVSTPETGRRTRNRIEAIIDYAKAKGWREADNPARWKGHLKEILPKQRDTVKHYSSLPYAEMPDFVTTLRERIANHGATSLNMLGFVIMTAARTNEARLAKWSEIDLEAALWSIPADRMKTGQPHTVPLNDWAIELLKAQIPSPDLKLSPDDYVFKSNQRDKPLSNMAMLTALKRMGRSDITTHGFRSTFRDWVGDCTKFPREVAEVALSHSVGDAVERSYRRSDALKKRRQLMEAWNDYCAGVHSGDVVWLHG